MVTYTYKGNTISAAAQRIKSDELRKWGCNFDPLHPHQPCLADAKIAIIP